MTHMKASLLLGFLTILFIIFTYNFQEIGKYFHLKNQSAEILILILVMILIIFSFSISTRPQDKLSREIKKHFQS